MLTIGMVSWGSEKTLRNTLESYVTHDLQADQNLVLLQEGTWEQQLMVRYFRFEPIVVPFNIGIAEAYKLLLREAAGDYFLFLENDWELLRNPNGQLYLGRSLIYSNSANVVRFRDRENPGAPLWTLQYKNREYVKPTHMLDCVHWQDNPDTLFPEIAARDFEIFQPLDSLMYETPGNHAIALTSMRERFYIASSRNANWTNNPHMARTEFLRQYVYPRMTGDIERDLQPWWEQQDFKVAQGRGLFTHNRLD